jgi:hypothetical protein
MFTSTEYTFRFLTCGGTGRGRPRKECNLRAPILCVTALLVASNSASRAVSDEISQADLIRLGAKAAQYKPADSFSTQFDDTAALGRTFSIRSPLKPNAIPDMPDKNGGWTYSADTGQLTLTVEENGWIAYHHPQANFSFSTLEGFEIFNAVKHLGHEREQNAFGAQVVVNFGHITSIGVAAISQSAVAHSVAFNSDWNTLVARVTLTPEQARNTVKNAFVVVQGTIVPLGNGRASLCDDDGAAATYSSPTSVSEHFCVFNAEISRVAIEANGVVLAEWKYAGATNGAASANIAMMPVHLGVHYAALDARTITMLHMSEDHGLFVGVVDDNSPAAKAGIQKADVILAFAGRAMTSTSDLQSALGSVSAGAVVPVRIWRGGQEIDLSVQF